MTERIFDQAKSDWLDSEYEADATPVNEPERRHQELIRATKQHTLSMQIGMLVLIMIILETFGH